MCPISKHSKSEAIIVIFGVILLFASSVVSWGADLCGQHVQKQEYRKGIEECTKAINSGKLTGLDLAASYGSRGIAYSETSQSEKALSDFGKVIELNP